LKTFIIHPLFFNPEIPEGGREPRGGRGGEKGMRREKDRVY
jgi:hypothetical protein